GLKDIASGLRIVTTPTKAQGGAGGRTAKSDEGGYQLQKVNDVFRFCFRTDQKCPPKGRQPTVLKHDFEDEKLLLEALAKVIDRDCSSINDHPGGEELFRRYCGDYPETYDKDCFLLVGSQDLQGIHDLRRIADSTPFRPTSSCYQYVVKL